MPPNYSFECGTCGRCFPAGWQARENHCLSTGHDPPEFECATCPRWFHSQKACHQHMRDTKHLLFECSRCLDTFPTETQCVEHEHTDHFYCGPCDRYFQSYNNLMMHLNSRVHRGRQIKCPFCPKLYTAATGMAHHLESGSCPNARHLDRDELYRLVRSKDPQGVISKNLIGWTGTCEYDVDERTWNGYAYECYLCQRTFGNLHSLNQHVNSATHQQALYHCPDRKCGMDFKSLAAIINHLESESCGYTKFERVQRQVGDIISGNRRIAL